MDIEKLKYLLNVIEDHICILIDDILTDSETDPHYSAVAATNRIKCYIDVMNDLGKTLPYSNVEEFFMFNAYTKEEYAIFEESRKKESVYYRDIQY